MKLSVIIPAFNVEKYIATMLDCLMLGINSECEVIVINDGSNDNTLEIVQTYKKRYPKFITIIDKKNGGSGFARNDGLDKAQGEYVWFIDPDDLIEPASLLELQNYIDFNDGYDFIQFGFRLVSSISEQILSTHQAVKEVQRVRGKTEIGKLMEKSYSELYYVWAKCYSREFLEKYQLRYTNQKTGQDAIFALRAWERAENILAIPDIFYNYHVARAGSAQTQKNSKKIFDNVNIIETLLHLNGDLHIKESGILSRYTTEVAFQEIRHFDYRLWNFKVFYGLYKKRVAKKYNQYINKKDLNSIEKRIFLISNHAFLAYLYNLYKR